MKKLILLLAVLAFSSVACLADGLGSECSKSSDCPGNKCLFCPSDTQFEIYTNEDWYSAETCKRGKEKYGDKFYCPPGSELSIVTRQGGEQGYCGRIQGRYGTRCLGSWNGDDYYIDLGFLRNADDEVLQLNKLLARDVLDVLREESLKMVSGHYFDNNFDINAVHGDLIAEEPLDPSSRHSQERVDRFYAYIDYAFKLAWAESEPNKGGNWVRIRVAEKTNGTWRPLSRDEMAQSYRQEIERWHDLGLARPLEYEIDSIISEKEALKKLKTCNKDLEIEHVLIESKNQTLVFTAWADVELDTENCIDNPYNKFTRVIGVVDLQTGEVGCRTEESACAVFSAKPSEPSESIPAGKKIIEPFQVFQPKQEGFFKRIIDWLKKLFS